MISAVIPARRAAFVAEAVRSAFAAGAGEVIVADATDEEPTGAIAKAAGARVIRRAHPSPGAARNDGVAAAKGSLIAFLDADDRHPAGRNALLLAALDATPGLTGVVGAQRVFGDGVTSVVLEGRHVGALLVRRDAFLETGGFREDLGVGGETIEWFARTRDLGLELGTIPDVVLERRLHDANLTLDREGMHASYLRAAHAMIRRRRSQPA